MPGSSIRSVSLPTKVGGEGVSQAVGGVPLILKSGALQGSLECATRELPEGTAVTVEEHVFVLVDDPAPVGGPACL